MKYTKRKTNKNKTKKNKSKSGKWTTAVDAATKTFKKTGSINLARATLRKQALSNARKLFGSI